MAFQSLVIILPPFSTLKDHNEVPRQKLTRSLPRVIFTDSHPGGQHFWQCCFRFWRKGWVFHCQTNLKCNATWSKVALSRHMMAPKLRFSCGLKAKAPGAVMCTAHVPAPTSHSSKFLQARRPSTEHKKQRWWRWGFFFLPSRVFQVYDRYFTNILTLRSCFESKFSWRLTRNVSLATMRVYSYWQSLDEDGRSLGVGTSKSSFTAILRAVWSFFSHQAPPSPVSSTSQSLPSFPSPSLSTRRNQLSPRSPSSRKHSNVQLIPACVASGNIHNAVSLHLDKTAQSIQELFSQWTKPKRASSDQRTDEEDTSETCNNNHVGGRALTNA